MRSLAVNFCVAIWLSLGAGAMTESALADEPAKPPVKNAWDLDDVMREIGLHPRDAYLQYVAMQLAKREGREQEVARRIDLHGRIETVNGGRAGADLFSTFTGALALQESLQLDTMRGERLGGGQAVRGPGVVISPPVPPGRPQRAMPDVPGKQVQARVEVSKLNGPTVQSHPWEKMLGNEKPQVGTLANCVPDDFWFAQFRSFAKFNEVAAMGELWGGHIFTQVLGDGRSQLTVERIKKQLGLFRLPPKMIEVLPLDGVAVAGSDLFLDEGSDVTLLLHGQQANAMLQLIVRPNGVRAAEGEYMGIGYAHWDAPGGDVHVWFASPRPDLHVRSNSLPAFKRVLEAIAGKTRDGKPVKRLGESAEFQYIRTLLPRGAAEEDGFIFLSDPFIRRLVGPQLKLSERRRVLVYNHLRMIGHAALMFRTEFGRAPISLEELAETKCAPGVFGQGALAHPDGGTYSLSADGISGVCSKYGRIEALAPCLEHLVTEVTGEEAEEYKQFVDDYNRYWRTYFDPIAIRIQASPKQYRLETLVLPLVDNSVYTAMSQAFGGKPVGLDTLPTTRREIGGLWLHFAKQPLLEMLGPEVAQKSDEAGRPKREGGKSIAAATNDLMQLALAILNYESTNSRFPPAAIRDKDGKPLLSWRVAMLPFLEQEALYRQFKLDEPWDSEHNKKLIAQMPEVFRGPNKKLNREFKTPYSVPIGSETIFPPDGKKITMASVLDGTSNTILIVEANDDSAVVWTKPDDLSVDLKKPLHGLERSGQDFVLVAMADGSVRRIHYTVAAPTLAAAFTRSGGEIIDLNDAERPKRSAHDRPKTGADSVNDLKQIGLAFHNYHNVHAALPPAAKRDANGKPLLSWRVAVLPFLEQDMLYRQFKLDEPWDSEHNKKLIAQMPRLFQGTNKKLNEEGKTTFVVPVAKETMFPPDGSKVDFARVTDGLSNTIMTLQASDDSAVIWTKPDDLAIDLKKPLNGLERLGQNSILAVMGDGSVRHLRYSIDPARLAALFTRDGGEVVELKPEEGAAVVGQQPFERDFLPRFTERELQQIADLGFDLNKLRRLIRDGIGDQIGLQMHDASKLFDYDLSSALDGRGNAGVGPLGQPTTLGIGLVVQFITGPSSVSIPVRNAKIVDEFLEELDRLIVRERAQGEWDAFWNARSIEFYRLPFPEPHVVRCLAVKLFGLKWRLYWGRIGDGLYIANRPFVLEDILAAQAEKKGEKQPESAHALLRLRPENWRDVRVGYNLGWAENHRSACHDNQSLLVNVRRGWNDLAADAPEATLMERVQRIYGVRPYCPDGGVYVFSAEGKSCRCSIHGTARDPRQPATPSPNSATGRLLREFAGLRATLSFEPEGLRAVAVIERR
jgi:hypothetical protein